MNISEINDEPNYEHLIKETQLVKLLEKHLVSKNRLIRLELTWILINLSYCEDEELIKTLIEGNILNQI